MNDIVSRSDEEKGLLQVGDTTSLVPFKVYQDVYHQITGRTEQIQKRYSDNLLLEFSDLEQIYIKIIQLCDVHSVIAKNDTVTIFHDKERKEQFTSFDRFRAYNASAASPCINVVLKFNFSITPPGIKKPQEYVVTIRLSSRIAIQNSDLDLPFFLQGRGRVMNLLTRNTAEITVDYVDYVIARGFIEAFDEWIRGCKISPRLPWLSFARKISHMFSSFIKVILVLLISFFALETIPDYFSINNTPETWARFIILYSAATYFLLYIGNLTGDILEDAVDTFPTLSYLKLNKGDENLIKTFSEKRNKSKFKLLKASFFIVILGIISAKLEKFITFF